MLTQVNAVLAGNHWVTVSAPGPVNEAITLTYDAGVQSFTFSFGSVE